MIIRKKLTSFSGTAKDLKKRNKLKVQKSGLDNLSRTFLSSLIIISIFFIAPLAINLTKEKMILSKDYENNSKNNLKKLLEKKGYKFKSQTDTEVITALLSENLKKNTPLVAIQKTLEKLHGSYALGILFKDNPDLIVGARRGSPLAVGYGHNENYLGSDSYALKSMTNKISYLNDGEFCICLLYTSDAADE